MSNSTVPTSVYQYYDRLGTLIYVGVTSRRTARQSEHVRTKDWWPLVERQAVEHYSTRAEALARESGLIRRYLPPFNTLENPDPEGSKKAYLRSLSAKRYTAQDMASRHPREIPMDILSIEGQEMILATFPEWAVGAARTTVQRKRAKHPIPCRVGDKQVGHIREAENRGPTLWMRVFFQSSFVPDQAYLDYAIIMGVPGLHFNVRSVRFPKPAVKR